MRFIDGNPAKDMGPVYKAMARAENDGHTAITPRTLNMYCRLVGVKVNRDDVEAAVEAGHLAFVEGKNRAALGWADQIKRAGGIAAQAARIGPGKGRAAPSVSGLTPSQKAAWAGLWASGGGAILGAAGTGKTYLASLLCNYIDGRVLVCAPTGKAAMVLQKKLGQKVSTIHSMLDMTPATEPSFNRSCPLYVDAVVVDEVSMISTKLFSQLLNAIDLTKTKLFMFGDVSQLQPVEPGAPILDLMRHKRIPFWELTDIVRQAKGSAIVSMAHRIRNGGGVRIPNAPEIEYYRCPASEIVENIRRMAIDKHITPETTLVISPTKRGKYDGSTAKVNSMLRSIYRRRGATRVAKGFYHGDMIRFNTTSRRDGFVNGMLGRIAKADGSIKTEDGGWVYIDADRIPTVCEHAYALTIHKAQGTEADTIVLALPTAVRNMYTAELLYTAVTRAKRRLIVVGDVSIVSAARAARRSTALDIAFANDITLPYVEPEKYCGANVETNDDFDWSKIFESLE